MYWYSCRPEVNFRKLFRGYRYLYNVIRLKILFRYSSRIYIVVYIFVGFLLREGTEVTSLGGGDFIGYTCQDFLAPVLGGKDFFTAPVGGSNYFVTYFLYKVPKITFFHKRGKGYVFFILRRGGQFRNRLRWRIWYIGLVEMRLNEILHKSIIDNNRHGLLLSFVNRTRCTWVHFAQ